MKIDAAKYVDRGFPPDEGKRLADALMASAGVPWDGLEIDVTGLPPVMLISAFFNGFLQAIHEKRADLLDKARAVRWTMQFPFQTEHVHRWMTNFKPHAYA